MRVRKLNRKGATAVLLAACLTVFLAMTAMSVNIAYIQLGRTELRAATDAAAKAATEALARQDSVGAAISAAIANAQTNEVDGKPLDITPADIAIGRATRQADGAWLFTEGAQPFSAVRVTATAPLQLFFTGITGADSCQPTVTSTAAFSEHEVCLVIDRSHSMCFDMSGTDWVYPAGIPSAPPDPVVYPPHASLSRWAALQNAMSLFLSTVENAQSTQKVALVTWGSNIGLDSYEGGLTGTTFVAAELDEGLGEDYAAVSAAMNTRGQNVMLGGTNLSAGIDLGTSVLTGPGTKNYAKKSMIVMTDGAWNEGRDPVDAAADAKAQGIVIHTITFLPDANQQDMLDVATETGGRHFHAGNGTDLQNIFRELALHLPVVLTD